MNLLVVALLLAISMVILVLLAVMVGRASAEDRAWRAIAAERRILHEQRRAARVGLSYAGAPAGLDNKMDVVERALGEFVGVSEATFLAKVRRVEVEANRLLDSRFSPEDRQLFQIRQDLVQIEAWTTDDLVKFDKAMAMRNEIVARDGNFDRVSLSAMDRDLDRLLKKLNPDSIG